MPKLKRRTLTPPPSAEEITQAMDLLKLAEVQQTTDNILIAVEEIRKDRATAPFTRIPTEQAIRDRLVQEKKKEKSDGTI